MQVTPSFRHTLDAVRTIRTIDTLGVSTRTFANVATADAYGTDLTVAVRGGRLRGFAGASAVRQVSNAANLGPGFSAKSFGWTARTNASLRLSPSRDLQALLFYMAPMTIEQGRKANRTRFSLAVRQKLRGDQMSLTQRISDPFNTSHESNTTIDARFTQVSDRRRPIRGRLLKVDWSFGKPDKDHTPEPVEPQGGAGGRPSLVTPCRPDAPRLVDGAGLANGVAVGPALGPSAAYCSRRNAARVPLPSRTRPQ